MLSTLSGLSWSLAKILSGTTMWGGILARGQFITGFHKAAIKVVNYEKLQEVIQDKHENPSQFLNHLTRPSYNVPIWIPKPRMENNAL